MAAPAASLKEILTPERQAELGISLQQSLAAARKILAQLGTRDLTAAQSEKAGLVRVFIRRAEAAKETDLDVAAELAKRARLLAENLAASR